jgi:hypothetical protein
MTSHPPIEISSSKKEKMLYIYFLGKKKKKRVFLFQRIFKMSVKRRRDSPDRYADEDLEVRRSIILPIHMIFHDFRPCTCSPRPDV